MRLSCREQTLVSEAIVMIYDENHNLEKNVVGEVVYTWVFALCLIGVVLLVIALLD